PAGAPRRRSLRARRREAIGPRPDAHAERSDDRDDDGRRLSGCARAGAGGDSGRGPVMERLGDEVKRTLARSGSTESIPLAAVTAAWPEVVGSAIARNAWPLRVARDGTLHIATSSATWSHELDLLGPEVLGRLRGRLGDDSPTRLRFAVGPVPEPPDQGERSSSRGRALVAEPTHAERAEADAAAALVDDPELRELVARAARASLVKARSGRSFW